MMEIIILKYLGQDSWSRPVYKDESGRIWKDADPYSGTPEVLCSATNNDFDGEPDMPMGVLPHYQVVRIIFEPSRVERM